MYNFSAFSDELTQKNCNNKIKPAHPCTNINFHNGAARAGSYPA
jgi:hypothetical protein